MKIALLHYSAPPVVGGVEAVLGQQARLMAEAGNEVTILAGRGEQVERNIRFVRVPEFDSLNPEVLSFKAELDAGRVPPGFDALAARIQRKLEENLDGARVLVAHNVCSLNKNLALTAALRRLARQSNAPHLILWHHDLAWTTPRYLPELHPGYPWDFLRTDWPEVTQVVVSKLRQRELAELMGVQPDRIHVVPNGMDARMFLKLSGQTSSLVEQAGLAQAAPLMLLPVRITRRKNIELAVRIVAELQRSYPDVALIVTGPPGPHNPANAAYFAELKALRDRLELRDRVHFLAEYSDHYLPDEVIADFYRLADALLLPSREEGFGIPILEAGLSRLPVFCTDIPSLGELGGEWVVTFSPDADPAQVAYRIRQWFDADPVYHLKTRVRRQYTWEAIYRNQIAPLLEES